MKKSMDRNEMEKVVQDLIRMCSIEKALEKISLKIEHPGYGPEYCFLCELYKNPYKKECKGCPYEGIEESILLGCNAILINFASDEAYQVQRKIDYTNMWTIAKVKEAEIWKTKN